MGIVPEPHGQKSTLEPKVGDDDDLGKEEYNDDDLEEEEYNDDDENGETLCGACGKNYASDEFWICCDICEKWFHGKQYKWPGTSSLTIIIVSWKGMEFKFNPNARSFIPSHAPLRPASPLSEVLMLLCSREPRDNVWSVALFFTWLYFGIKNRELPNVLL